MRIQLLVSRAALLAFLITLTGLASGCLVINIEKSESSKPPANAKEIKVDKAADQP